DAQVGDKALRLGEIPLDEKRLDAGAVNCTVRREDSVNGHDFDGVFEIAANRRAGEKIGSEDEPGASTNVEKLGVGGFAGSGAAAEERAEFPGAAAVGKSIAWSSRSCLLRRCGAYEKEKSESDDNL